MALIEVRTVDRKKIMVNPDLIASIEPSRGQYPDETDLHFAGHMVTISMTYEKAVALLCGSPKET